jgi:putative restriction endonuclease
MNSFDTLINKSNQPGVKFFILDTKGVGHKYDDQDFLKYSWSPKRYNLVKSGDVFIYRRPNTKSQRESFYFFGAGIIGSINNITSELVQAEIINPVIFDNYLYPIDLINFKWAFKQKKRDDWQHFFNQYGMMQIDRLDFIGLIQMQFNSIKNIMDAYEEIDKDLEVSLYKQIHQENYKVEDKLITQKVRGSAQAIFAKEVKGNYLNRCCITGINTKRLLIASHIIPWSEDSNNRLNPANGLCLSPLFDKAFDLGLITINPEKKIIISKSIQKDKYLNDYFNHFEGNKIFSSVAIPPKPEFLKWHNEHVFEKAFNT